MYSPLPKLYTFDLSLVTYWIGMKMVYQDIKSSINLKVLCQDLFWKYPFPVFMVNWLFICEMRGFSRTTWEDHIEQVLEHILQHKLTMAGKLITTANQQSYNCVKTPLFLLLYYIYVEAEDYWNMYIMINYG